jgi:hypothetical protein
VWMLGWGYPTTQQLFDSLGGWMHCCTTVCTEVGELTKALCAQIKLMWSLHATAVTAFMYAAATRSHKERAIGQKVLLRFLHFGPGTDLLVVCIVAPKWSTIKPTTAALEARLNHHCE